MMKSYRRATFKIFQNPRIATVYRALLGMGMGGVHPKTINIYGIFMNFPRISTE